MDIIHPDHHYMQKACTLARSQLGRVWPNPAVGCLIVKSEIILASGVTGQGGCPHAETVALQAAKEGAQDATLYVTLEPCAHEGKTPPCTQSIIHAGIARVVIACNDPDPRVNGKGIAQLKAAGIDVTTALLQEDAEDINRGFLSRIQRGRPWIIVKLATTLDGKMALSNGQSQWITSEAARARGHELRASVDAIATGIGTVLADDPELTCRIKNQEGCSPVRIVLDRRLEIPVDSKLVQSAKQVPLWVQTAEAVAKTPALELKRATLAQAGVTLIYQKIEDAQISEAQLLSSVEVIATKGINTLLIEAGPTLTTRIIKAGLADELYWFRAPSLMGGDGKSAVGALGIEALEDMLRFERIGFEACGADVLEIYRHISNLATG